MDLTKVYSIEKLSQDISLKKYHMLCTKNYKWVQVTRVGREVHESITNKGQEFKRPNVSDIYSSKTVYLNPLYSFTENTIFDLEVLKKIPKNIILQVRTAMQKISESLKSEAVVFAIYDHVKDEFFIKVPPVQKVSSAKYDVPAEYS